MSWVRRLAAPFDESSLRRWSLPVLFSYLGFAVFCVWGHPPLVDLPAQGAQVQTLVELLRGAPDVADFYKITFPIGYGLVLWLSVPLAFVTSGGFAVKVSLWVTLALYPWSMASLLKAHGRSPWMMVLGLPLAFNVSYWYGLLSGLFAQPLLIFALAALERLLAVSTLPWRARVGRAAILGLLCSGVLLSHLLAFMVLLFLGGLRLLLFKPFRQGLVSALMGLLLPLLLSLPKVLSMAREAVQPSHGAPPTEYNFASHINWFFKNYHPEGRLQLAVPLGLALLLLAFHVFGKEKNRVPLVLFLGAVGLYFATPKTLSGIFLIAARLPVLAGVLSLLLWDARKLPRAVFVTALFFGLAALGQLGMFHARFRHEIRGLAEVMSEGRPPPHGYVSLAGWQILGSQHIYLEHLGQWVTAERGGVGHHFFADAAHHPVRFRAAPVPASLYGATPQDYAFFKELYVFGDGPVPPALSQWREVARSHRWRRLVPPT